MSGNQIRESVLSEEEFDVIDDNAGRSDPSTALAKNHASGVQYQKADPAALLSGLAAAQGSRVTRTEMKI